jgi:predicted deacetylase
MSDWLVPLRVALAERRAPLEFFVRDDDAGRADAQLFRLLDVFESRAAPLDLAVIPAALQPQTAEALRLRRARWRGLNFHQHGYAHVNHEREGRKCEFGPTRGLARQQADIRMGKDRLAALLGDIDPIFTPPWNRCTQETVSALKREGLRALSREAKAAPLALQDLYSLPVSVDWRRQRGGVRETPRDAAAALAEQVAAGAARVGLMLHHQVLDDEDFDALDALLTRLRSAPNVRLSSMMEFVEEQNVSLIGA